MERWKRGDQPCPAIPFHRRAPQSGRAGHAKAAGVAQSGRRPRLQLQQRAIKHSAGLLGAGCWLLELELSLVAPRDAAASEWEAGGRVAAAGGQSSYGVGQIWPSVNGS